MTIIKTALINIGILTLLYSCSSTPKIPVWEISKEGHKTSYILGSSNYLTKADIDKMLTNDIILMFDSCKTYISLFDFQNSSLTETKNWIEIGNSKSLSDTLPTGTFTLLKTKVKELNLTTKLPYELPDSIKIKPQFYINDILKRNDEGFFNIDQFFFKRAMPQNKNITGFISLQDYYKAYSNINFNEYLTPLNSTNSLLDEKKQLANKGILDYKNENYSEAYTSTSPLFLDPLTVVKESWTNKIYNETTKQSSFIVLDINYISPENENGLFKKLLSKGYQLTRVN
jgi:uncharacterized protein YbaP (TraB family)